MIDRELAAGPIGQLHGVAIVPPMVIVEQYDSHYLEHGFLLQ